MNIKKPPDRYKTYKNSFKSIIKDNVLKNKIQDSLIRTNKIIGPIKSRVVKFLKTL